MHSFYLYYLYTSLKRLYLRLHRRAYCLDEMIIIFANCCVARQVVFVWFHVCCLPLPELIHAHSLLLCYYSQLV